MNCVLIVDDEAPLRSLLRQWVELDGASAIEAGSAEEGLACLAAESPAVALCDIRLPGQDGLWLAAQIHSTHPQTAVVMTTGVLEFGAAVTSLQSGVVDYLVKPFSRDRLREALNRALFAHRSRRALDDMQRELDERRAQITDALGDLELHTAASLEAMLAILRARDPDSYEHAHRVAHVAVNLAMALRIGEPQLSDIERAAMLHNLGRLALPDRLVSSDPSDLSEADCARFCAFPLHGQAMLKNVPFLTAANDICVAAHERYDGSGFPRGLAGNDIPLGARVVAVADAYDDLVSGASGAPVSPARALDILAIDRIAQFDPMVLGALTMLQPSTAQLPSPHTDALQNVL